VNERTARTYAQRFERVFDHIERHLDAALPVDELSDVANFSRFHFQRQFSEYVGLSVTRYVQLVRLRRASNQLALDGRRRIIDIALEAGFENPESFSRAFKKSFGQTPSQFRAQPAWRPWNERLRLPERERSRPVEVKIVDFEETLIAVLEHRGNPALIYNTIQRFIDWRERSGLSPHPAKRSFGLAYNDPEVVPAEEFRFDIAGEIDAPVPENPHGVDTRRIPAGRCALARHLGATDRLGEAVYHLYREWLPAGGEELRDFPLFFHYVKKGANVPEHEVITDVYLPLK